MFVKYLSDRADKPVHIEVPKLAWYLHMNYEEIYIEGSCYTIHSFLHFLKEHCYTIFSVRSC
jgi:hypothetical protein